MRHITAFVVLLFATVLFSHGLRAQTQASDFDQAISQFYPVDRLQPRNASERYACYQALDTPVSGHELLVVAYTDRSNGAVRVLRRNTMGAFEVVFDNPTTWDLSGRDCVVRLNDVDLDGQPEVFVYFFATRYSSGWIFQWDGSRLENLTATELENGRESSIMFGPTVYDLHHEGAKRVVAARDIANTAPGVRPRNPAFVYRLGPSGLEVEGTALLALGFRADVDPAANQRFFRLVTDSTPPLTLRVINGERDGQHRVDGAIITINNIVVLGHEQINAGTEFTTTVLSDVFTSNELHAELTGSPDARIIVLVEDATPR